MGKEGIEGVGGLLPWLFYDTEGRVTFSFMLSGWRKAEDAMVKRKEDIYMFKVKRKNGTELSSFLW